MIATSPWVSTSSTIPWVEIRQTNPAKPYSDKFWSSDTGWAHVADIGRCVQIGRALTNLKFLERLCRREVLTVNAVNESFVFSPGWTVPAGNETFVISPNSAAAEEARRHHERVFVDVWRGVSTFHGQARNQLFFQVVTREGGRYFSAPLVKNSAHRTGVIPYVPLPKPGVNSHNIPLDFWPALRSLIALGQPRSWAPGKNVCWCGTQGVVVRTLPRMLIATAACSPLPFTMALPMTGAIALSKWYHLLAERFGGGMLHIHASKEFDEHDRVQLTFSTGNGMHSIRVAGDTEIDHATTFVAPREAAPCALAGVAEIDPVETIVRLVSSGGCRDVSVRLEFDPGQPSAALMFAEDNRFDRTVATVALSHPSSGLKTQYQSTAYTVRATDLSAALKLCKRHATSMDVSYRPTMRALILSPRGAVTPAHSTKAYVRLGR